MRGWGLLGDARQHEAAARLLRVQGLHTVTLVLTILKETAILSNQTSGETWPAADVVVTKSIPFYKLTSPYTDKGAINQVAVRSGANITISITDMWPEPAVVADKLLLQPVYHVWGRFQEDFDGNPYDGAHVAPPPRHEASPRQRDPAAVGAHEARAGQRLGP